MGNNWALITWLHYPHEQKNKTFRSTFEFKSDPFMLTIRVWLAHGFSAWTREIWCGNVLHISAASTAATFWCFYLGAHRWSGHTGLSWIVIAAGVDIGITLVLVNRCLWMLVDFINNARKKKDIRATFTCNWLSITWLLSMMFLFRANLVLIDVLRQI